MNYLRWALAFPMAVGSWLFFPYLCSLVLPASLIVLNRSDFSFGASIIYFLSPVVSIGVLIVVLPPAAHSSLKKSIHVTSALFVAGTLLLTVLYLLSVGPIGFWVLFLGLAGTAIGYKAAYAYLPLKCRWPPRR